MFDSKIDESTASRSQNALVRLASIDPIELCNEAKVERCRAIMHLRSCGRNVQRVHISCGHAALCEDCSQRCDVCPICRVALLKGGNDLPLRLYDECIEAGLISKKCDERSGDEKAGEYELIPDVQRLYSLFDVALQNNLASLICHYITDVCMDETAVSSDSVTAYLLNEMVVKDWCSLTFRNILTELQKIYKLSALMMKSKLSLLQKISSNLVVMCNVIEVFDSSFKGSTSAMLHDLNHLQESISKTKQHLEIMIWCIRYQLLENVRSRYSDFASWCSSVRERKSEAIKRAWPETVKRDLESSEQSTSSLFIEDALSNLDTEQAEKNEGELIIESFLKAAGSSISYSKLHGMATCYPFENLRYAVDLLFLQGKSDMVVAKQAIFLYYLFDRHRDVPSDEWRAIVDDFAVTFDITRHSLLESYVFYLLDDYTNEALEEACQLLPEITAPNIHPKVAQTLLERHKPEAALMVLRWSGRDGGETLVSLGEAVTAVRVRVECGLLTEAFMYQRMICTKVKDNKSFFGAYDDVKVQDSDWQFWVKVLVSEFCCLCIHRNLVDRMIDLPWNSNEEKHLHMCLFEFATGDPSSTVGCLLVAFYLQRYRYIEAYQVDCELETVEEDFISKNPNGNISDQVRSMSHWRKGLVSQSVDLLPDTIKQQLKSGKLPEVGAFRDNENNSAQPELPKVQESIFGNLLSKA